MTDSVAQPDLVSPLTATSKPNVLHVLHSWGGGIDFFAGDLQAGDQFRNHFFLKSHSRDNLPPFGKELCLYRSLDRSPLATWYLSTPLMDTDLHSAEVTRIMASIIEKWAIGAVIVSSLIGHSLDVLNTGLPTALAVHDAYPFWPLLHDANTDDHSLEYLRKSLIESKTMNVFAQHDAEYWLAIREELISLVLKNKIACISPSIFAKERVCRIDSRLSDANWSILPHGLGPQVRVSVAQACEKITQLTVLVPGHINGGKGEVLLKELIPQLPEGIHLVLLGSAHLSEQFTSEKVTAIDYYQRNQLSAYVAKIRPDVAVLASTVPETYGYVLSEMLQLGLPVICSNIGAYAERGSLLPGVTLVEPKVESFLEQLIRFRDNPEQLLEQKKELPYHFPSLDEMANSWMLSLPTNSPKWLYEFTDDPGIENEVIMNLQLTHLAEILKKVHSSTERNTQENAENSILLAKQQSNIESLLETVSTQNLQLATLMTRQNQLTSTLQDKDRELENLRDVIQQQFAMMMTREKIFDELIEKIRSSFDQKLMLLDEAASADKAAQMNASLELQARIALLDENLGKMQATRAWRFFKLFR